MKWILIVAGVILLLWGIVCKRGLTDDAREELKMRRRRRQAAMHDFNRPLSERELIAGGNAIVFLLSPWGMILVGAALILAGLVLFG